MRRRNKNIQLLVSDVDGVWTDGSFYYTDKGDSLRRFNTRDSYGIQLARYAELPVLILSGENNPMVASRMEKLKVDHVLLGVRRKLEVLRNFCQEVGLDLDQVAFVGDDMNDYALLDQVGFFACPADAYPKVKERASSILTTRSGDGVFREFVELILAGKGILDATYTKYLEDHG